MPLHDWTRAAHGMYHTFHQVWAVALMRALNEGRLPDGFEAFVEQRVVGFEGDVLAIDARPTGVEGDSAGGVATTPRTRFTFRDDAAAYGARANRVVIRAEMQVVAVIEILSPGNKDRKGTVKGFVAKTAELIDDGIHVLAIDPFPPGPYDPYGMHAEIWGGLQSRSNGRDAAAPAFEFPAGHDRLAASYSAGSMLEAFVETLAVGDAWPDMPLFIADAEHILTPLEESYLDAWRDCPPSLKKQVAG